jgi:hypothetical protein
MKVLHEDEVVKDSRLPVQQSLTKPRVAFSVLNVVKDDKNFDAFFGKYLELQQKCDLEKITT